MEFASYARLLSEPFRITESEFIECLEAAQAIERSGGQDPVKVAADAIVYASTLVHNAILITLDTDFAGPPNVRYIKQLAH